MSSPGEDLDAYHEDEQPNEYRQDLSVILTCPDCKEDPPNIVEEFKSGDTVCASCGRVLAEHVLDTRSEWRTFSNDDDPGQDKSRVGDAANPLLEGSQLITNIASGFESKHWSVLSAQNKITANKTNNALQEAFIMIDNYCDLLLAPKLAADSAKFYYSKVRADKELKNKPSDVVIAPCLLIGCQHNDVARSLKEVFGLFDIKRKGLMKSYNRVREILRKDEKKKSRAARDTNAGPQLSASGVQTHGTSAASLVARVCAKLALVPKVQFMTEDCAKRVAELGIAEGRAPGSVCGACLYFITRLLGIDPGLKKICDAAGMSESAVRAAYKEVDKNRKRITDKEWLGERGDLLKLT